MSELIKRADKVAFWGCVSGSTTTFKRMPAFTELSNSKNPKEYTRQYVDKNSEVTDVVGYSPSTSFSFDQIAGDLVHADITNILDKELIGSQAIRDIVMVDLTQEDPETTGKFIAKKTTVAVIGDTDGDSTDAYTYSGNLKSNGQTVWGHATSVDNWETCTFTADA